MDKNLYNGPIILVEDNPVDIDLTIRAFEKRNVANEIIVLRDGEEASDWIEGFNMDERLPVVILLDLKLPKINGLEVLRLLKRSRPLKHVPVVILTTSTDDTDIATAYEYGANSYIVKPVDFAKFIEVAGQVELYWNILNRPSPDGSKPLKN